MAHIASVVSNGCSPDPRVLREARWLVEEGHEVTIHAFDRLEELIEEEDIAGIRIARHRVGVTPYGGTLATASGIKRFLYSVREAIENVDLIHCHDADTLSVGLGSNSAMVLFDVVDEFNRTQMTRITRILTDFFFLMYWSTR